MVLFFHIKVFTFKKGRNKRRAYPIACFVYILVFHQILMTVIPALVKTMEHVLTV